MIKILHFCTNQIIGIIIIEIHLKKTTSAMQINSVHNRKNEKRDFEINTEGIVRQIPFNLTSSVT